MKSIFDTVKTYNPHNFANKHKNSETIRLTISKELNLLNLFKNMDKCV